MKNTIPPDFMAVNTKCCASCYHITKIMKTKNAFCQKHKVTFPLYESSEYYYCSDHEPVVGQWDGNSGRFIKERVEP